MEDLKKLEEIKDHLYLISVGKTYEQLDYEINPRIYSMLYFNGPQGEYGNLSAELWKDKQEINEFIYEIVNFYHFNFFKYVKQKDKIEVYLNLPNCHSKVDTQIVENTNLNMLYEMQETGKEYDNFIKRKCKWLDYNYNINSWMPRFERMASQSYFIKKYLEVKDIPADPYKALYGEDYTYEKPTIAREKAKRAFIKKTTQV